MAWGNRLPWDTEVGRFESLPDVYGMPAAGGAPTGFSVSGGELIMATTTGAYYKIDTAAATSSMTLEMDVKVIADPGTNLYGSQVLVGNGSRYVDVGFYTTIIRVNDNGSNFDTAVDLTRYRRVRLTVTSSTLVIYVDGVQVYTRTIVRSGSNFPYIGQGSSGTGNWRLKNLRYSKIGAYPPPGPDPIPGPGSYGFSPYGSESYGGGQGAPTSARIYEEMTGTSQLVLSGSAIALKTFLQMTGTSQLVLGGSGILRGLEYLTTWTVDDSGKAQLVLSGVGSLDVVLDASSVATNQIQQVNLGPATSGTFTITFLGQTTTAIPYNASAAVIQAALVALSNINSGDVLVTGGPAPGTFWIEYTGQYAATAVTPATIDLTLLVGGVAGGGTLVLGGRSHLELLKRVSHTKPVPVLDWRGKPI